MRALCVMLLPCPTVWAGNPNGISLAEAQRRYQRYGAIYPGLLYCRLPRADEPLDPAWEPRDDPTADVYQDFVRDLVYLVSEEATKARDEVRSGGDDRARGRLDAWGAAVALVVRQAKTFGMSADDIGLPDGLDPSVDFSPDPPTGHYAG